MNNLGFVAVFVMLGLAALVAHIIKVKWEREDAFARDRWAEEEAVKAYAHQEPSQVGPSLNQHLGIVSFLAWIFTIGVIVFLVARLTNAI